MNGSRAIRWLRGALPVLTWSVAGCGDSGISGATAPSPTPPPVADTRAIDPGTQPWAAVPRERIAADCGLDPARLDAVAAQFLNTPVTIVRFGKLCWSGGYPGGTTTPYSVYSVTKTFGAILFGMVMHRSSLLRDTDSVTEWIPPEARGAINPQATLAHVLAMTSTKADLSPGNKGAWSYDTAGDREINTLVAVMDRAIKAEPTAFGGITTIDEFAIQELFEPLGMTQSTWPGGAIGGGLVTTVEDMSRMGLLLLRKGRWNGRQLMDERYVYRMTHPAFEDTNTGYGYLTQMNAAANWTYSTGTADLACAPYTTWPRYPHAPFREMPDSNGGTPFTGGMDLGLFWAAGTGGQKISVQRGLDLVITVRDDVFDPGADLANGEGIFEGHKRVWRIIRPALLALDPIYANDEAGFCAAYQRSAYAPGLVSPWSPEASQ